MSDKKLLPKKTGDLSDWYTTVIQLAELADYGPAKGTMIIRPYGYAIWENIQAAMDPMIKQRGVKNAYYPLFIPTQLLEKEATHVEGFAPELAIVTHGGGEELEDKLAVRPTSETIMYHAYAKWVQSWRDLPIMENQWNNVVRWEKRTTPFLRTSEFLWQEGHTVHATHEEALAVQRWAMSMYTEIYRNVLAIDGFEGHKSAQERFAGALDTLTFESLMPSGKSLQACTSHDLAQNFSKAFGIRYQDTDGGQSYAWQSSWGLSTRSIGGLILAHGDDNGLCLPPKVAPLQVVIVPVKSEPSILRYCATLADRLQSSNVRVHVDERDDESFGFKLNKWEVRGVPIVLKIGAKEADSSLVTAKRRFDGEESSYPAAKLEKEVAQCLESIQSALLKRSKDYLADHTKTATSYQEFKDILAAHRGFIKVFWHDAKQLEEQIKSETKATSRCRPLQFEGETGNDFMTGEPNAPVWIFAQSY